MSFKWKSILPGIVSFFGNLGSGSASSKLANYETAAQTAVKAAVTKVDDGIGWLQAAFNQWEDSNPLAKEAITGATDLLKALGIQVPDENAVVTHVKAAVADLAGIFVPQTTTASTTATGTTATDTTAQAATAPAAS
ncbi:hypothetical protein NO263_02005 [Gluconacetobacter entanii]|uniref:Uncharacterized protein n=1 Tax=Gluconacetobacter entanii TaxID=108528 RepID=A0ABT3K1T3_9PROT|nr:hypothetical protein [Gluconacetobacter entanii]MCW4589363.1 hypothetical protein [Gluconacetobacter entanii]MCW4592994.1 hypothetical protein [Gluconacetobacter entanii]NPC90229.1 hypothetical protein [Gluconacetobacter entanii]